jgi:hypothetical protein
MRIFAPLAWVIPPAGLSAPDCRIGAGCGRRLGPASAGSLRVRSSVMARKRTDCSFCGKGQDDVRIIAGPNVWICDGCVQLCSDILWPDEAFPWSVPESHA